MYAFSALISGVNFTLALTLLGISNFVFVECFYNFPRLWACCLSRFAMDSPYVWTIFSYVAQ